MNTEQSDTPRTNAVAMDARRTSPRLLRAVTLARTLEREADFQRMRAEHLIDANKRLREALVLALPLLDAWLNGDGTNIDMDQWDAATTICRAALVQS